MKIKIIILTLSVLVIGIFIYINKAKIFNYDTKQLVKKYIFPYKLISQQEERISQQRGKILQQEGRISKLEEEMSEKNKQIDSLTSTITILPQLELTFKVSGADIQIKREDDIELSNNKILRKKNLVNGFYYGIYFDGSNPDPIKGSGYIDFYEDDLFILSSRGVLAFTENIDNGINFKQIKNNINDFIGLEQFKKSKNFSLKDLFIDKNKIFISYTEEIKEDCWNTSIIYGDLNYEKVKFEKLFSNEKCIHSSKNIDGEFNALQSGGRIINFDDNHILLTVGEYRSRYLAQKKDSINGKIIKININNLSYEIISMGHRNNQGLYFDKENNFLLATEHGAQGGDEINLIEVDKINSQSPLNYGWPIVSAGEHYNGKIKKNEKKYKKYPLYKSHKEHGFIEPLISFELSIGISEITKISQNKYVASSLLDKSLYFFELDIEKKLVNLERVEVFERVRDLKFKDDKLYLFLDNTNTIGIISLN